MAISGKIFPMPPSELRAQLAEYLSLPSLSLATAGHDGQPHSAEVYFAAGDDLRLYFFSEATSQHAQDLAHNPRASATITPPASSWEEIRGLQMRGEAYVLPEGAQCEAGWRIYRTRFPFVAALGEEVARNALYVFIPDWIRLVDNRRGFGFKQEWGQS